MFNIQQMGYKLQQSTVQLNLITVTIGLAITYFTQVKTALNKI